MSRQRNLINQEVEKLWYCPESFSKSPWYLRFFVRCFKAILYILSLFYQVIIALRKKAFFWGIFKSFQARVPVIVVGNVTVGGTGKTPLVIALSHYLKQGGYRPGIVSRGYGGHSAVYPLKVTDKTTSKEVGDEPIVIANRTLCPVVVAPNRPAAIQYLLAETDCNIIVSDDGLQHLAMKRDIEIIVIDGKRQFGNTLCLPAGPLREPLERCREAHFLITNQSFPQELQKNSLEKVKKSPIEKNKREYFLQILPESFIHLSSGKVLSLDYFNDQSVHVVTGIGNPQRFLETLTALKLTYDSRLFPDHHNFTPKDFKFSKKAPIIMTEKDAVKCKNFSLSDNIYYLKVVAEMNNAFKKDFLHKLNKVNKVFEKKKHV